MRRFLLGMGLLVVAVAFTARSEAQTTQPQPPDNAQAARAKALDRIRALPWKDVHELRLPASKATLVDLPGFAGLAGDDARTFRSIVDGRTDPSVEGDVIRRSNSSEILFSWNAVGYVDAKDFSDIDPDKLIESVREATFAGNEESQRAGQRPITAVDWASRPGTRACIPRTGCSRGFTMTASAR